MKLRFRLDTTRLRLLLQPGKANALARQEVLPAVESATLLLHREISLKTPVGATGRARGSIQPSLDEVRGRVTTFRGTVMSAAPHILPLEHGSKPHWAPIKPLKRWAKTKVGNESFAYAVQWAIARRGTKGAHMFRDGLAENKGKIDRILRAGVERWRLKLGGK